MTGQEKLREMAETALCDAEVRLHNMVATFIALRWTDEGIGNAISLREREVAECREALRVALGGAA